MEQRTTNRSKRARIDGRFPDAESATREGNTELSTDNGCILPNASLHLHAQEAEDISVHRHNSISPAIFDSIPTDLDSELFLQFPDVIASDTHGLQIEAWPDFDQETRAPGEFESQLAVQPLGSPKVAYDICAELQTDDTLSFTFPDDRVLEVPSLTLLNAAMKVAQRLNVSELIWDFSAISPFYQRQTAPSSLSSPPSLVMPRTASEFSSTSSHESTNSSVDLVELPPHLRPTPTQSLIRHHPILDLLPWPSTRNKLIQVFSLPAELRPESAQDPMALLRLVHDLEDDGGEGVRINGQDPFEPCAWEIGQVMLDRWWWAFEVGVVEMSNRARENRGEKQLMLVG